MPSAQLATLLRHLHKLAAGRGPNLWTDRQLLDHFAVRRDESAFAALVARHGSMVLRVCRRVLNHEQDAEDAFQAAFLVLARNSGSIHKPEALANWLHGVAYRTAMKAKRSAARRRHYEARLVTLMPTAVSSPTWDDVQAVLDEEIQRLPEVFRTAFVLCILEGKSGPQAAAELGVKEGTVSSRLTRARQLLQKRLVRRGIKLSALLAALSVAESAGQAALPAVLANVTVRSGLLIAAGKMTAGVIPSHIAALAAGVTRAMFLAKLKSATAVVLAATIVTGAAVLTRHVLAATESQAPFAPQPPSPEQPTAQADPGKPQPAAKQPERPRTDNRVRTDRFGDPLPDGAILRIGTIRYRAGASINKAALSPDGKLLASADEGGVMLIELATGKPRRLRDTGVPNGFGNNTSILAFSPDGKELVNVSVGGNLQFWDVLSGKLLRQHGAYPEPGRAMGIAAPPLAPGAKDTRCNQVWFPAAGKRLVVALTDTDNSVQILDAPFLKTIKQFPLAGELASVAGDGKSLAAIDANHSQVVLYDDQGKELRRFGQAPRAFIAALDAQGKLLITVNQASEIRLWDAVTGKEQRMIKGPVIGANEQWLTVAISPDAKVLFAGITSGDIHRWDLTTGKELEPLRAHRNMVTGLFFPPGGRGLVSVAWDGVVHRWNLATGKPEDSPDGYVSHVQVARSPDGRTIAIGDRSGRLESWDASSGRRLRVFQHSGPHSTQLAFSPDGKLLVVAQSDGCVRFLDAQDGREVRKLGAPRQVQGRGAWFPELVFSPDGRFLVASEYVDGTRMWEVATGKEVWHVAQVGRAAFSPDGRTLVTGYFDQVLTFRDATSGKEGRALKDEIIDGIAFSPDGSVLATGHHSGRIYLRDPATGAKRKTLEGHREVVWMVSFSPSGKWLASGGDETIRIWEVATGKELLCLKGHEGRAYQVLFGPDSRTVLSSSLDLTALLWSIRPKPASSEPISLDSLWSDLGGEPVKAYAATWALADDPKASSAFLRQKISPVKLTVDEKRVQKLLEDVDSNRFQDRQAATLALKELGLPAEAPLRAALKKTKSTEVRNRITQILDGLKHEPTSEDLRRSRAVQALELAGAAEAKAVLAEWAAGTAYAPLTQDAGAALARLRKQREFRGMP